MLLFGQHLEKLGLLFIATSVTLLAIKIVVNWSDRFVCEVNDKGKWWRAIPIWKRSAWRVAQIRWQLFSLFKRNKNSHGEYIFFVKLFFSKGAICGLFFFIIVFSIQLTLNKCSFADDWIRTADLWCRKRRALPTVQQPVPLNCLCLQRFSRKLNFN